MEIFAPDPTLAQKGEFTSSVGFQSIWEVLAVDPMRSLKTVLANVPVHFRADVTHLVGIPVSVLALLGIVVSWRSWMTRRNMGFAMIGMLVFVSMLPIFYNPRFMLTKLIWWAAARRPSRSASPTCS